MYIEQALLTYLLTQAGLTALVNEKIYYVEAPQDIETPYIVMSKVSSVREHSHQGSSHLATARFQFSTYASSYYLAKQIAEQLQTALQGISGVKGTAPGVRIGSCLYDGESDFYEDETKLYHIAADYMVMHEE